MIRLELDDLHCSISGLCSDSFKMYKLVRMVHNPSKGSQCLKFANFLLCSLKNTHTHILKGSREDIRRHEINYFSDCGSLLQETV